MTGLLQQVPSLVIMAIVIAIFTFVLKFFN